MSKEDASALRRLLGAALAFFAIPAASAALSVSSDFESGSARVLALDDASQTVRISPAGDGARGWPNWWYFRMDGIDPSKPLTVEVDAREAFVPMMSRPGAKKCFSTPVGLCPPALHSRPTEKPGSKPLPACGVAEWLAGSDPAALRLRRNIEFYFVPIMDVDHVATGDGGKDALPQDQNRDWSDSPHWPEVASAQQRIRRLAQEGRMAVFLDLHNPQGTATQETFYVQHPPYLGALAVAGQERFLEIARQAFGPIRLIDEQPSENEDVAIWRRIGAPWVSGIGNPGTLSLTIETPWNTPDGTIDGYRRAGEKLGLALAEFIGSRSQ